MKLVPYHDRALLPAKPGLYYVYQGHNPFTRKLLYVGLSKNLRERHTTNSGFGSHHRAHDFARYGATHIGYRVIDNMRQLKHEEALAIIKHRPPLNKRIEKPDKGLLMMKRLENWLVRTIASGIVITCLWRFVLPMVGNWLING